MSSIRKVQVERALSDIIRLLYSEGTKPTNNEIRRHLSEYFTKYPAGRPIPFDTTKMYAEGARTNVEAFNETMLAIMVNVDTLYKATMEQVEDVMKINTALRDKTQRLKDKRRRLATKIDDYLLSLYNTDGYYYSIADSFTTLDLVDLAFSSAHVDTAEGSVSLPIISRLSSRIPGNQLQADTAKATIGGKAVPLRVITGFDYASDGNTNTVWACEVDTSQKTEVILTQEVFMYGKDLSKIEVDPYGMTEAQWSVAYGVMNESGTIEYQSFGDRVLTTSDKFALRQDAKNVYSIRFTIRKTRPDYDKTASGTTGWRYIFGAKEIALSYQSYDTNASLVTFPLLITSDENADQLVIDAVSLVADAAVPDSTSIKYFIAEDQPGADSLDDFKWLPIRPVDETSASGVVRFDGAALSIKEIVDQPNANDLEKIVLDDSNTDPNARNPSYTIVNGDPIYRLAKFDEKPLLNSLRLEEGVNTTRIYHTDYADIAVNSLEWWTTERANSHVEYARIDTGNEFFYGGDIGESSRSVMIETYVDVLAEMEPVVAQMKKTDPNSKVWQVRAFLNGSELGFLDVGVDTLNVTWPFQKGLNHVVLLINIPAPSDSVPNPYVGTLELMIGSDLFDYGNVNLGVWNYIDFFDLEHNQRNDAATFTIHNNELISRRQPIGNMRVVYAKQTNKGPAAVRLRADLGRDDDASTISPSLRQYRLRFSYSDLGAITDG